MDTQNSGRDDIQNNTIRILHYDAHPNGDTNEMTEEQYINKIVRDGWRLVAVGERNALGVRLYFEADSTLQMSRFEEE